MTSSVSRAGRSVHPTGKHRSGSAQSPSSLYRQNELFLDERQEEHDLNNFNDGLLIFFRQPHRLTVLAITLCLVWYTSNVLSRSGEENLYYNAKLGIAMAAVAFLIVCGMLLPDAPFRRPHPVMWRLVTGFGILYFVGMVFLLHMDVGSARQFLRHIDSSLGEPLEEREYASNVCFIFSLVYCHSFTQFKDTLFDEFVLAHSIGWFCKALMIRHVEFLWISSAFFEFLEYTFEHQLPNFKECWWDHWILDFLLCNGIGIYFGMKACRFFDLKEYNWVAPRDIPTQRGRLWRLMMEFTPLSWDTYHWDATSAIKRFFGMSVVLVVMSFIELNAFFIKYILWVPPSHYLNVCRLFLMFLLGVMGIKEWYIYISHRDCKKLGRHMWLTVAVQCTETLVCIKFGRGMFPHPWPTHVIYGWIFALGLFVVFFLYVVRKSRRQAPLGKDKSQ